MSYCVKCGVELSDTEKKCPLCFTPVWIFKEKEEEIKKAYPEQAERVENHPRKSVAILGLLLLFIPIVICMINNIIINGRLTWTWYVMGAELCVFTYIFAPFLVTRFRAVICIVLDVLVTCLFLYEIAYLANRYRWLLKFALPITCLVGIFALCVYGITRLKKVAGLHKAAIISILLGVTVTIFEMILNLFISDTLRARWSLVAMAPLVIVAAIFVFIEANKHLKERLIRIFFI